MNQIWLQKYRPKTLEQIQGNTLQIEIIKNLVKRKDLPHILLTGPPGVGKTSSILCAAKQIFIKQQFLKRNFIEINGSDQRGQIAIKKKIKNFMIQKLVCKIDKNNENDFQHFDDDKNVQEIPQQASQEEQSYPKNKKTQSSCQLQTFVKKKDGALSNLTIKNQKSQYPNFSITSTPLSKSSKSHTQNDLTKYKNKTRQINLNLNFLQTFSPTKYTKKIFFLDQCDILTPQAMKLIFNLLTKSDLNITLALSCNDQSTFKEVTEQKCLHLRFNTLKQQQIIKVLIRIIKAEKIRITQKAVRALAMISNGDTRNAINNLQACYTLTHFQLQKQQIKDKQNNASKIINQKIVFHICDVPSISDLQLMLTFAFQRNIKKSLEKLHQIFLQGYSSPDICKTLSLILPKFENKIKSQAYNNVLRQLLNLQNLIKKGLYSELQFGCFLSKIAISQ